MNALERKKQNPKVSESQIFFVRYIRTYVLYKKVNMNLFLDKMICIFSLIEFVKASLLSIYILKYF